MSAPNPNQTYQPETPIEDQARTVQLIWLALTFSSLGFAFVAYMQTADLNPVTFAGSESMAVAMSIAAAFASLASMFTRRNLLSEKALKNVVRGHTPLGAPVQDPRKPLRSVMQYWRTVTIVCLALHEMVSIFGLLLALALGDWTLSLPFVLSNLALNALIYPNFPKYVRLAGLHVPPQLNRL